jgi:hypothetical protein
LFNLNTGEDFAMTDQHSSPAEEWHARRARITFYKALGVLRLCTMVVYFGVFLIAAAYVCMMLDSAPGGLGRFSATLLFTLVMFCSGDLYTFVRDRIENHVYCPRYDRASQSRPPAVVSEPSPLRCLLFLLAEWGVPLMLLRVLLDYGFVRLQPGVSPIEAAGFYALAFAMLRIKLPMSVRDMLRPFMVRLPRPDSKY